MDDLDFSTLTNDQLIGLMRALLRECVSRGGAIHAAAQSAVLDEHERAEVSREAAEREAGKIRAQERERVAREAAEAVRRQRNAQEAAAQAACGEQRRRQEAEAEAARQAAAKVAAADAVLRAGEKEERRKQVLRRAAELVGREPGKITLVCLCDDYHNPKSDKVRVLINEGGSARYARDHLADYSAEANKISTVRSLVANKLALLAFCVELSVNPCGVLCGADFSWEESCQTN